MSFIVIIGAAFGLWAAWASKQKPYVKIFWTLVILWVGIRVLIVTAIVDATNNGSNQN